MASAAQRRKGAPAAHGREGAAAAHGREGAAAPHRREGAPTAQRREGPARVTCTPAQPTVPWTTPQQPAGPDRWQNDH